MSNEGVVDYSRPYTTITAELLRDFQVPVTIERSLEGKGHGPWSFIIDEGPESGSKGAGPSPVNVAVAALAA